MGVPLSRARMIRDRLLGPRKVEEAVERIKPRLPAGDPLPPRVPAGNDLSAAGVRRRLGHLAGMGIAIPHVSGAAAPPPPASLEGNIENFVGYARVPIGVIGPLRVNGSEARGDFYVPLATTEGAMVASYNRGAYLVSQSGGASVLCLTEAVLRSPAFIFDSLADSCAFLGWMLDQQDALRAVVASASRHCRLLDMQSQLMGKEVYLRFEFHTGDAAGQNMVTLATDAICRHAAARSPVKPRAWYVEGNFSGDKKATMLAFLSARGKKVVAEAVIPRGLLARVVHAQPAEMARYWQVAFLGGAQSGSIGVEGHFANGLAGLFIACGQDAACVAEAATGVTRMDLTERGDLYASVSLPNLIVGTVGGGTRGPTARECLRMIGCDGDGGARKFAEICAATVLAGEISIIGALAAGEFASAHARYGRPRA
jgi:hydroxymethylglutaryl-CoA reductase (NADPH)